MSTPEPPVTTDPPDKPSATNWRNIVANIIIAIVAIATALPAELGADSDFSIWLSSTQVVGVIAILQALLRIPPISNWVNAGAPPAAKQLPAHRPPV